MQSGRTLNLKEDKSNMKTPKEIIFSNKIKNLNQNYLKQKYKFNMLRFEEGKYKI
jgi:hypothetical protein